jgi:hypothetical protein
MNNDNDVEQSKIIVETIIPTNRNFTKIDQNY